MIRKWIVVLNYNVATHCVRLLESLWQIDGIGVFFFDSGSAADYAILRNPCTQRPTLLVEHEGVSEAANRLASGATRALVRNQKTSSIRETTTATASISGRATGREIRGQFRGIRDGVRRAKGPIPGHAQD